MRTIKASLITDTVEKLCLDANYFLSKDVYNSLRKAANSENELAAEVISTLVENADLAREKEVAMCQDTGMAVVFVEIGQELNISGGLLSEAINEGVRRGYEKGYLRKSVVIDPINRVNTKDNTPAVIHYDIVSGDKLKIILVPKGFGSENKSGVKMLEPSAGLNGVMDFVVDVVEKGGASACPPLVVGVGIGGTMEKAALLSKTALLRDVGRPNNSDFWHDIEEQLKNRINQLGIGPGGLGGKTTVLCVNIETYPTHIAGLPVAVNLCCHASRHAEAVL